jgi:hypothetical protein
MRAPSLPAPAKIVLSVCSIVTRTQPGNMFIYAYRIPPHRVRFLS